MFFSRQLVLIFALSLPVAGAIAQSTNEITPTYRVHMLAKPAVVRIVAGYKGVVQFKDGSKLPLVQAGTGSGFFISPDGYIMTNAHVVEDIKAGEAEAKKALTVQFVRIILKKNNLAFTEENIKKVANWADQNGADLQVTERLNRVLFQDGSKLPYEIKSYGAPMGSKGDTLTGKDVAIIKVEMKNAPTLRLGDSSKMKVGDRVYVMGYPGAADSDMLDAKSSVEPTTNDGAISAIKTTVDGIPVLQTSTSATHGNSGGPVLNQSGEVIGMLTFRGDTVNGQEVQGFNFIVPSNTAREYLAPAGTTNAEGLVDRAWTVGLDDFWSGRYTPAKQHFEEVVALVPSHNEARKLITEAQEHILRGDERKAESSSGYLMGGSAAVAVLLLGGGIFAARKHKRPAPAQAAARGMAAPEPARPVPQAAAPAASADATVLSPTRAVDLVFVGGPLSGQQVRIPPSGAWIGRDANLATIVVAHHMVSKQHVWVGQRNGRWVLRDEASTNGTFVNDPNSRRITEHYAQAGETYLLAPEAVASFRLTI
ncbi:MAG: trypsin-like peptidase domain-containing protein [Rhodocyclaceae bacterium]|nr:trypsin-like peptidase domain-containing protein [Rhodocyclaceae bacterium]MBX3666876.1 trypsin-like peptidase domain-containing protein [Rhodocyclaceae bacterium]